MLRSAPTRVELKTIIGGIFDNDTYVLTDDAHNGASLQYQRASGFDWVQYTGTTAAATELKRLFILPSSVAARDVQTVATAGLSRGFVAFVRKADAEPLCGYFFVQPARYENIYVRLCAAAASSDADFKAAAMQFLQGLKRGA